MRWLLSMAMAFSFSLQAAEIKLLSWNVFMLPKPIKFSSQAQRTREIASQLKNTQYDFIFIQEAFTTSFRSQLQAQLKTSHYPYSYYLKRSSRGNYLFGSGLLILGSKPFKLVDQVYFNLCWTADCYSSKGAVLIETQTENGESIQLVNTHLQAQDNLGHIRLHQLQQIKEMLSKHYRSGVPQLLVGDLNIDPIHPEFIQGQQLMGMGHFELAGAIQHTVRDFKHCSSDSKKSNKWLDHIWVNTGEEVKAKLAVKSFDYLKQGNKCPLSDHHAIEARITLTQN